MRLTYDKSGHLRHLEAPSCGYSFARHLPRFFAKRSRATTLTDVELCSKLPR